MTADSCGKEPAVASTTLTSQPLAMKSTDQLIQQFRVCGWLALPTKVPQRSGDAAPEHQVPKAIDKHSCGQSADSLSDRPANSPNRVDSRGDPSHASCGMNVGHHRLDNRTAVIQPIASRQHADLARCDRLRDHRLRVDDCSSRCLIGGSVRQFFAVDLRRFQFRRSLDVRQPLSLPATQHRELRLRDWLAVRSSRF